MLYIVSPFESAAEARGTRNLAIAELAAAVCPVTFITTNFSHQNKRIIPHTQKELAGTYKTVVLSTIPYRKNLSIGRVISHWWTAMTIFWYLLKNVRAGDKVLVSTIPPEILFLLRLLTKKVDIYLDVRDIWPDAFPAHGSFGGLFRSYCNFLYRRSLSTPHRAFYVAPSFKKWLSRYQFNLDRAHFIPLGFDKARWTRMSGQTNVSRADVVNLVYVGYLESQFDLTRIIEAVNSTANIVFHVVGSGSRAAQYAQLSETDRIRFYGAMPPLDATAIVHASDMGVLPIVGHAQMPNKLFDYVGAQIPILCIGECDSADFVRQHDIGFALGPDPSLEEIQNCLDVEKIKQKKQSFKSFTSDFSKEAIYPELIDLMELP